MPVWAPASTGTFFHTAVQLARLYWGMPLSSLKLNGDHLDFVWPDGRVQARVPMRDRQLVDINWFSPWILRCRASVSRDSASAPARNWRSWWST